MPPSAAVLSLALLVVPSFLHQATCFVCSSLCVVKTSKKIKIEPYDDDDGLRLVFLLFACVLTRPMHDEKFVRPAIYCYHTVFFLNLFSSGKKYLLVECITMTMIHFLNDV